MGHDVQFKKTPDRIFVISFPVQGLSASSELI